MTNYDTQLDRIIPEERVWKCTYDVSHAPHYTIQLPSRIIVGTFAPVENVERDPTIPFSPDLERVNSYKTAEHITVTELNREQTPFSDSVVHERIIPENRVWLFDMGEKFEYDSHYVIHQLQNGQFLSKLQRDVSANETPQPVGLSKEQVLEKRSKPEVSVQPMPIHQSLFAPVS